MDLGLKDRNVIVAAASEGIARSAAEKFAAEGARVALCSRDLAKLRPTAEAIADTGATVLFEALDVTDEAAVQQFVAQVAAKFGSVDVCITNAGGPPARMFLETTTAEWKSAVDLNLMSTIHFARAVIPHMQRNRWGRIVTITSVSVRQPVSDLIYSNTVRAGALGLLKSLSNEFGKDGITVNNVAPGYAATARLRSIINRRAAKQGISEEAFTTRLIADAALKRVGEAAEIADAILFLASDRASYITGQTLLVDGGLYKGL
ncbi:SDR family oxidoreductase [Granulicella arctica]|uniref:SDR family oxidoreductase n=1 Tax=Granulicella arctica TaxID=940613 RepID=UPI0021DFD180|nr:SDR family oxidoreductase [Granulicella arctica]